MLKAGLFQEMKRRVAYDKPSVKRKRAETGRGPKEAGQGDATNGTRP